MSAQLPQKWLTYGQKAYAQIEILACAPFFAITWPNMIIFNETITNSNTDWISPLNLNKTFSTMYNSMYAKLFYLIYVQKLLQMDKSGHISIRLFV